MLTEFQKQQNRIIKNSFFEERRIPEKYQIKPNKFNPVPFGYIYCIENKTNHKKYIGSAYSIWNDINNPHQYSQLKKRATNYIYEYNRAINELSDPNKPNTYLRPIIQAMVSEGIDNFVMYPIAETTRDTHQAAEVYFINLFDTYANGYNVDMKGAGLNKIGKKLTAKDKLLRSEGIVAINLNHKQIMFSDSMKLFGDYMNSTKDMIKNACRKGRPYKGWFIFYIDPEKRLYILDKNVRGDGLAKNDRHSDKSKRFYEVLCGTVSLYLQDSANPEYFSGFEVLYPLEYKDKK